LGFSASKIHTGVYAADTAAFEKVFADSLISKQAQYPKKFLFVGRFVGVKGLEELIPAYAQLRKEGCDWELELVGTGEMKAQLEKTPGVRLRDFVQPAQLPQLAVDAGAFVLPSRFEPWGVVLHEFAAAGLPIIASDACGAASAFLKSGENGFQHHAGNTESLTQAMRQIWQATDSQLLAMGQRSVELSRSLSPQSWASTLETFLPR
jgi:glycosyltransferase involved in cell wall biosynthesis